MVTKTKNSYKERENLEACCHYWLIDTPNGSTCKGICKLCGEEKEFAYSLESLGAIYKEKKHAKIDN